MARLTTLQHFDSVHHLAMHFGIVSLPRPKQDWRLLKEPFFGEIVGIPSLRGCAVATNGIIVAIVQANEHLTFGHLDNLIADTQVDESVKAIVKSKQPSRQTRNIEEFI
jgi:hypothetical protein